MEYPALALLLLSLSGGVPDDELVADSGVFTSRFVVEHCYLVALREALLPGRAGEPVQMVAIPSFDPAYAVFVERGKAKQPRVVARRMKRNLWAAAFEDETDGNRSLNEVSTCELFGRVKKEVEETSAPIGIEHFDKLRQLWQIVLATVRPPTTVSGLRDGVKYFFGGCSEVGCISGIAESPRKGTRLARLVNLGDMLVQYSKMGDAARLQFREKLGREIDATIVAFEPKDSREGASVPPND